MAANAAHRRGKRTRVVRDTPRQSPAKEANLELDRRIAAILRFARFAGPTGEIDQLLGEIERGRSQR